MKAALHADDTFTETLADHKPPLMPLYAGLRKPRQLAVVDKPAVFYVLAVSAEARPEDESDSTASAAKRGDAFRRPFDDFIHASALV